MIDFFCLSEMGTRPVMVFPIGNYKTAKYAKLKLTKDMAEQIIENFDNKVLGATEPFIDSSGKHDEAAPAAGWIKRLFVAPWEHGEALFADVEWTSEGKRLVQEKLYRYLSAVIAPHVIPETGEKVWPVLRSMTLTNVPVLRMMPAVQASDASEFAEVALSELAQILENVEEVDGDIAMAEWDTAYINNLPDSCFAYIAPGGKKDADGKTIPRSLRSLPYKGADGKVDLPHLRNALARLPQTNIPAAAKTSAQSKLEAAAKKSGVGTEDKKMADEEDVAMQKIFDIVAQLKALEDAEGDDAGPDTDSAKVADLLNQLAVAASAAGGDGAPGAMSEESEVTLIPPAEIPVAETPAEETSVEEVPAEESPTDESPAEETPADKVEVENEAEVEEAAPVVEEEAKDEDLIAGLVTILDKLNGRVRYKRGAPALRALMKEAIAKAKVTAASEDDFANVSGVLYSILAELDESGKEMNIVMDKLIEKFGLSEDATEDDVIAAYETTVTELTEAKEAAVTRLAEVEAEIAQAKKDAHDAEVEHRLADAVSSNVLLPADVGDEENPGWVRELAFSNEALFDKYLESRKAPVVDTREIGTGEDVETSEAEEEVTDERADVKLARLAREYAKEHPEVNLGEAQNIVRRENEQLDADYRKLMDEVLIRR